jgi:hypothetical protein
MIQSGVIGSVITLALVSRSRTAPSYNAVDVGDAAIQVFGILVSMQTRSDLDVWEVSSSLALPSPQLRLAPVR